MDTFAIDPAAEFGRTSPEVSKGAAQRKPSPDGEVASIAPHHRDEQLRILGDRSRRQKMAICGLHGQASERQAEIGLGDKIFEGLVKRDGYGGRLPALRQKHVTGVLCRGEQ